LIIRRQIRSPHHSTGYCHDKPGNATTFKPQLIETIHNLQVRLAELEALIKRVYQIAAGDEDCNDGDRRGAAEGLPFAFRAG
jgi:hypothetical protein